MSLKVITFGCRLNIYESAIIEKQAKLAGLENVLIFNSCAVTKEAERKLRQAIRKAKKEFPEKQILVTGCAAQIHPEKYSAMPEVNKVFGNHEKVQSHTYEKILRNTEQVLVNDIMSIKDTAHQMVDGIEEKSKAFLQIQNGCNHRCTFCIIPYGRGNSRSVPVGEIVKSTQNLINSQYKEIILTGVDITDYGSDLPGKPTLGNMINRLFKMVPNIERLRLSSIDVAEVDEELFSIMVNDERFMPYVHLSLQAGDDLILKRMKRRHRRDQVIEFCHRVWKYRPEVVFGADIIAGFPTETETMFSNTRDLIQKLNIMHLHVFPYSSRENTPASRMPQVDSKSIKSRAKQLRDLQNILVSTYLKKKVGTRAKILAELNNTGYTEDYFKVISTQSLNRGEIYELDIKDAKNNILIV